jgi:clathrin heavy chain
VLNYQTSDDDKWVLVGGITAAGGGVKGALQVYSVAQSMSQPTMDSHAACFASVTLDGKAAPSTLFCFTQVVGGEAKLNILELGVPKAQAFSRSSPLKFQQVRREQHQPVVH